MYLFNLPVAELGWKAVHESKQMFRPMKHLWRLCLSFKRECLTIDSDSEFSLFWRFWMPSKTWWSQSYFSNSIKKKISFLWKAKIRAYGNCVPHYFLFEEENLGPELLSFPFLALPSLSFPFPCPSLSPSCSPSPSPLLVFNCGIC